VSARKISLTIYAQCFHHIFFKKKNQKPFNWAFFFLIMSFFARKLFFPDKLIPITNSKFYSPKLTVEKKVLLEMGRQNFISFLSFNTFITNVTWKVKKLNRKFSFILWTMKAHFWAEKEITTIFVGRLSARTWIIQKSTLAETYAQNVVYLPP
jgi:hypothetical protein